MKNKDFTIKENPMTGGYYAFFEHDGFEFYADLCLVPEGYNECMIFLSENEQVVSWHELYCKHGIPVTKEALKKCIREFIKNYDGGVE